MTCSVRFFSLTLTDYVGALVYHIRRCLHDYSDVEAVTILRHIAAAMAPDSKLLIVELILADPPTPHQAMSDLIMMTISGKERTLNNWGSIVTQAGLKIVRVSTFEGGRCVIECVWAGMLIAGGWHG